MYEVIDGKKVLTTPVSAEDLKNIHIGDIVYLNGDITTCRDVAHRRVVEYGRELPVDVKDKAILHAGPIIRPLGDDKFEMVSVGPTTSMRMENLRKSSLKKPVSALSSAKAVWAPTLNMRAKTLALFIAYSPQAMLLWQQLRYRKSLTQTGVSWVCRKLCGAAM